MGGGGGAEGGEQRGASGQSLASQETRGEEAGAEIPGT